MDNKSAGNRVVEHLMFANTPRSLFEALRRTPEVLLWSLTESVDGLVTLFRSLVSNTERTMDNVATAYAILVAIGLKSGEGVAKALDALPVQQLEWGPTFRELIRATIPAVSSNTIKFRALAPKTPPRSESASQSSTLDVVCKP